MFCLSPQVEMFFVLYFYSSTSGTTHSSKQCNHIPAVRTALITAFKSHLLSIEPHNGEGDLHRWSPFRCVNHVTCAGCLVQRQEPIRILTQVNGRDSLLTKHHTQQLISLPLRLKVCDSAALGSAQRARRSIPYNIQPWIGQSRFPGLVPGYILFASQLTLSQVSFQSLC